MTDSTETPKWRVREWDDAPDGGINFMIESPEGKLFVATFLLSGGWHVESMFAPPATYNQSVAVIQTVARYIIGRAFGGKTS